MKKIIIACLILSGFLFLLALFFNIKMISNDGMKPTIKQGTLLVFLNKSMFTNQFNRGDIVTFKKNSNGIDYIGRVIGLPTESVRIENGHVYVETKMGQFRLSEPYLTPGVLTRMNENSYDYHSWVILKSYEYFILRDNRNEQFVVRDQITSSGNVMDKMLFAL